MDKLLAEMFGTPTTSGVDEGGIDKAAESRFAAGIGAEDDTEMGALSDADLDALILELEGQTDPTAELDKIASQRLAGEVACHAFLHEERLIKVALAEGKCRFCKEAPLDPTVHPTLCSGCLPA